MKKINSKINCGTKVKLAHGWYIVTSLDGDRNWIKVAGLESSFQAGHILKFTNQPIKFTNEELKQEWEKLNDLPVDEDGFIEEPVAVLGNYFTKGTEIEELWREFDVRCPNGVGQDLVEGGLYNEVRD